VLSTKYMYVGMLALFSSAGILR